VLVQVMISEKSRPTHDLSGSFSSLECLKAFEHGTHLFLSLGSSCLPEYILPLQVGSQFVTMC
jgi:hypothetical protein